MLSTSAPTPRATAAATHPTIPLATTITTTPTMMNMTASEEKSKLNSAKSVFPLFFDVL